MDYEAFNRMLWDRLADAWDRQRAWNETSVKPVTDWLLDKIAIEPGQTILDLAAGNGEVGMLASPRLGHGKAIVSDLSANMVATARRRGESLGISNVDYKVMDAEKMELADESVDAVVCRWGYMLMPHRDVALAETRRVLRRGGRLAFSVWAEASENPFFTVPGSVLIDRGLFKPDPSTPNMFFTMSRPEIVTDLVTGAGFHAPTVERVELQYRFANADAFWTFMTEVAGPFAMAMSKLGEDERVALRAATEERCKSFRSGDGFLFPAVCLVAAVTKP